MTEMKTGLHIAPLYSDHDPGAGHPESPARNQAILKALTESGQLAQLASIPLRKAEVKEVAMCHPQHYIELVQNEVAAKSYVLSTGDTHISEKSYDIAMHAVGGVLNAVDAVMNGKLSRAFCSVRPPGHHARPSQGMGFCLFNNIAIGARYAQKMHGAAKIAIVDWDVHHGNGTQDIFYDDGSVFFASTHQSPLYPYTGHGEERGTGKGLESTLNLPFAAGAGMKEIGPAFQDKILPEIIRFKPDLIMISAGFDSREGDPLGRFQLTDEDFEKLTRWLRDVAEEVCEGRLISVLEGGYNLPGLSSAVNSHVKALAEEHS